MNSGQGGGGWFSSIGGYISDPGFWVSVVVVSVGVSIVFHMLRVPGSRS